MKKSTFITIVFLLLAVANCIAAAFDIRTLEYVTKPLLIPALLILILVSGNNLPGKLFIITGLIFSWAGDVLLMLVSEHPGFFIAGLVCFLTTHICYIIYFLRIRSSQTSLLKKQPWWIVLITGYGIGLVSLLFPHLGALTLPVIVYAAVICTMLLCSLHVYTKVNAPARIGFVFGAALFVLSDSLLAINKFYQPFAFAGVLIMLTYCAAQLSIVKGYLNQRIND